MKPINAMVHPLGQITIYERTEGMGQRLRLWAKGVQVGFSAPFQGLDECVWYATKTDGGVSIFRTDYPWVNSQEAVNGFEHYMANHAGIYVTSIQH